MLIGKAPRQIRVWGWVFRFWLVKTLVRLNPLVLFAGSPIYVFYLRVLGAKIGRDVLILSPQVPVCTDLLTIGDNTVICKDSFFSCYSAHDGVIYTGPVAVGKNAFVGERTVLEIGSSLGDGAQLGHSSSLHAGHPAGRRARWGPPGSDRGGPPTSLPGGFRRKIAYPPRAAEPCSLGVSLAAVIMLGPFIERPHFGNLVLPHFRIDHGDAPRFLAALLVPYLRLLYVVTVLACSTSLSPARSIRSTDFTIGSTEPLSHEQCQLSSICSATVPTSCIIYEPLI
jgi:non-ribosomal peptide synthetase-like protein